MSMRAQRDRVLVQLGGESGKVNDNHLFLVKNIEKREEKQFWIPVPGSVISMFVCGGHEWRYLGPKNSQAVKQRIAEIDKAQEHIMGEHLDAKDDNYEVGFALSDLGLGELPEVKDALNVPLSDLVAPKKNGAK